MKSKDELLQYFKDQLLEDETQVLPALEEPEPEPPAGTPMVYRNFANNYGADIRNFANGYQGYEPGQAASQPEKKVEEKPLWPWILADSALLAAIVGILIWWAIMAGGSR